MQIGMFNSYRDHQTTDKEHSCALGRGALVFFIIITRPKSVHYHLHIEMAYFLRVHNAHHGKKHNRDQ